MSDDGAGSNGAHFDLAAVVGVGMSVGSKLDKFLDDYQRGATRGIARRLTNINVTGTSAIIKFEPPRDQRIWELRALGVWAGNNPFTASTDKVVVCVGQNSDTAAAGAPVNREIVVPALQPLPAFLTFSRDMIWVSNGETVYLVGNVADVYNAVLTVSEYNLSVYDVSAKGA